jgi:hypothetical protein
MKTINQNNLILSILFVFLFGNLFAGNDGTPTKSTNVLNSINGFNAPAIPKETTFTNDVTFADLYLLAPVTPREATFYDENEQRIYLNLNILAPLTPKEAGFDNDDIINTIDLKNLALVTPAEADFE